MIIRTSLAAALLATLAAAPARAQARPPVIRTVTSSTEIGYVDVNVGLQPTTTSFDLTTHPLAFVEPATVQTTYSISRARGFDFGGGVHLRPNFAVGVAVSRLTKSDDAAVDAQEPHPFFFGRPRPVTGTAPSLARGETAFHAKAVWMIPVGDTVIVSLSGGPSFFKITQDLVDDITISQTYPYDTASFNTAVVSNHSGSGVGFNGGVDITFLLTPHVGIGVAGSLSRAKVDLTLPDDSTLRVDAGGVRVGGGVRFRF
jgi:opacity protein-like surface antigen